MIIEKTSQYRKQYHDFRINLAFLKFLCGSLSRFGFSIRAGQDTTKLFLYEKNQVFQEKRVSYKLYIRKFIVVCLSGIIFPEFIPKIDVIRENLYDNKSLMSYIPLTNIVFKIIIGGSCFFNILNLKILKFQITPNYFLKGYI